MHLEVTLTVAVGGTHADFTGTSGTSRFGINVPIVDAQAYFTSGMIVALAPELPNNLAPLAPFTVSAPDGAIRNAKEPEPVSVRHVIGHFVTDLCLGALARALPERVPAEGAGALWNFQASARSADRSGDPLPPVELLMFKQRRNRRPADARRTDGDRVPVGRHDDERRGHRAARTDRDLAQRRSARTRPVAQAGSAR